MAHHKRKKPKNARAGCTMCKPWKMNGARKSWKKMSDRRKLQKPVDERELDHQRMLMSYET